MKGPPHAKSFIIMQDFQVSFVSNQFLTDTIQSCLSVQTAILFKFHQVKAKCALSKSSAACRHLIKKKEINSFCKDSDLCSVFKRVIFT